MAIDVDLDRALADAEPPRDLLVRQALGGQPEDLLTHITLGGLYGVASGYR